MVPEFGGGPSSLIQDCSHSHCTKSNEIRSCTHLDERATTKCWPRVESRQSNQDNADEHVPTGGFGVTHNLLEADQSLPDTQRNSANSHSASVPIQILLHGFSDDLPDTLRNELHHQNIPMNPIRPASSDSNGHSFQDTQTKEFFTSHRNEFPLGSRTQLIDTERGLAITLTQPNSPLSETQKNELLETSSNTQFDADLEPYLPETQPNTPEWVPSTPSSIPLLQNQHSPKSNISQDNDSLELINSTGSPQLQTNPTQNSTIFAGTQSSSAENSDLRNLADTAFLKAGTGSRPLRALPKAPHNKVNCRERKRIIISSNRPPALTKAMCQWVDKTNYLLDPFREDDDCWFHPLPPPAQFSMNGILRPCGKLQKRFNWKDRHGKHSLVLNFGIACKLVNYKMTKQQKDGFINKQWHLSHLCGNWTCLNPAHTTVEPGNVNISRNNCFSHRSGCLHNPQCMKDKKVPLGTDGKVVDLTTSMASTYGPNDSYDWDDWAVQGFSDGDDFILVDENNESEGTDYKGRGDSFVIADEVDGEV